MREFYPSTEMQARSTGWDCYEQKSRIDESNFELWIDESNFELFGRKKREYVRRKTEWWIHGHNS